MKRLLIVVGVFAALAAGCGGNGEIISPGPNHWDSPALIEAIGGATDSVGPPVLWLDADYQGSLSCGGCHTTKWLDLENCGRYDAVTGNGQPYSDFLIRFEEADGHITLFVDSDFTYLFGDGVWNCVYCHGVWGN